MLKLTIESLRKEAAAFSTAESHRVEKTLFGITDGKAIGTYLEHRFKTHLQRSYELEVSSSASGIDFPNLLVDIKVTNIHQPQSSCPFKSARQKIYGLGYSLLVFVYEKTDNVNAQTASLKILHTIFVNADRTADFQITRGILQILANEGNRDDIIAFLLDKNLPADEMEVNQIADEVLNKPPKQGYLTISNALQWRLQYSRVIEQAGQVEGIYRINYQ
ncbi:MAG: restriction endonuclease [Anaerolineae bacterium]|nr:restriction endonuclease [Anaerolineae bacterium]